MKTLKKTISILVILLLCSTISIQAQDSYIKKRLNFKLGYSKFNTNRGDETRGHIRVEGNYGVFHIFEAGIYLGGSTIEAQPLDPIPGTSFSYEKYFTPSYGLSCNIHILPLLIKAEDFRFDLYLAGKLGGIYFPTPDSYYPNGQETEYGIGAGIAFYPWEHVGIYTEYSLGEYFYEENVSFRIGASFKF